MLIVKSHSLFFDMGVVIIGYSDDCHRNIAPFIRNRTPKEATDVLRIRSFVVPAAGGDR